MTYRERRERRADRLREWADKRVQRASATLAADDAQPFAHDIAFLTQPGHIPERARMIARSDRAHESLAKAQSMARRADSIDAAAAHAIYSDDPDAIERLRERIADLEAERARIVAYNKAVRAAGQSTADALALLDPKQRADLASTAKYAPYQLGRCGAFPAYALSNLGGNISRQRQRLADMLGPRPRSTFQPDRRGACRRCGEPQPLHTVPAPGAVPWCPQ